MILPHCQKMAAVAPYKTKGGSGQRCGSEKPLFLQWNSLSSNKGKCFLQKLPRKLPFPSYWPALNDTMIINCKGSWGKKQVFGFFPSSLGQD